MRRKACHLIGALLQAHSPYVQRRRASPIAASRHSTIVRQASGHHNSVENVTYRRRYGRRGDLQRACARCWRTASGSTRCHASGTACGMASGAQPAKGNSW